VSDTSVQLLLTTFVGAAAALLFRWRLPAVLTQAALLLAFVGVAAAVQAWAGPILFGTEAFSGQSLHPVGAAAAGVVWWVAWAAMLALLARLQEVWNGHRAAPEAWPAIRRRADLTRIAAGLVAVVGATIQLISLASQPGAPHQIVEIGVVFAISAVLLILAGRAAPAYLLPAAVGLVIGLTWLNNAYIQRVLGSGLGLLLEGAILLGVAAYGNRVRGRFRGPRPRPPAGQPEDTAEIVELPA
jgi:hypothetical protein